ncbi:MULTISPECIES: hypothetical protein [unclassified Lysobacter]|uniref:hypothetical protein n=1 Tax=unclassified Lysobacter TaxID=2635362 RepID=UPI001BEC9A7E|nr:MULTISPECIES: hypothetical protein [unclassified Lysobacter]MBT2748199.1 hypothetical protein [Lysobacter sp. ISL-42]MBT2753867.1 hypothetical protein [Lysobacter sp. ISL-50]MBT2778963.1 hypothetical protein [Lysobacter sp. ISL-54]MBT2783814.1 hypothetical protein [Lysobacter sp. ISL-52]
MRKNSLLGLCGTLALCLLASLPASATPPPDVDASVPLCNGAYTGRFVFDFGYTTSTATVVVNTTIVPANGFSPPPPPVPYYTLFSQAGHRNSPNDPRTFETVQRRGENQYPSVPAEVVKFVGRSPTCELSARAVIDVVCPNGTIDNRHKEQTWIGCGL